MTKIWKGPGNASDVQKLLLFQTITTDQFQVCPPAPHPECQPSQATLEKNSPEYLTSLANFEVGSVLRVMEQPEMYADYVDASTPPTPAASKTTGSQHGTPILQAQSSKTIDRGNSNKLVRETPSTVQKEKNPAVGFRPIHRPPSMSRSLLSPQVTHSQGMALLDYAREVCSSADPSEDCHKSQV